MKEELLKGLSEEQIAKLKECKNQEEMLAVAKKEGIELSDEQLAAVSGGCGTTPRCPKCGSTNFTTKDYRGSGGGYFQHTCQDCHHWWTR